MHNCIKTMPGKIIPRPMWYMVYATRPFEYIHLDFVELPDASDGYKYVLVVTDDFSLTTLLHPTKSADSETVVDALLQHWLPYYPDPELMHTDGGSHFDNAVVQGIAKKRGWKFTICTPYAKWAHGVAERNNRTMLDIMTKLCRALKMQINKWPRLLKLVQGAMQRQRRPSRGNMSPIQLTTGIQPKSAAAMLKHGGNIIETLERRYL